MSLRLVLVASLLWLDLSDPAIGLWPKLLEEWLRGRGLPGAPRPPGVPR